MTILLVAGGKEKTMLYILFHATMHIGFAWSLWSYHMICVSSPFNLLNFVFIYGLIITLIIDNVLLNWLHCRTSKTLERYQRCCYTSQDSNVANREAQVCVLWHFGFPSCQIFCDHFHSLILFWWYFASRTILTMWKNYATNANHFVP